MEDFLCLAVLALMYYKEKMKSITVRLPDKIAAQIDHEATARGVSKSDVIRERLEQPSSTGAKNGELMAILERCWSATEAAGAHPSYTSANKQKLVEIIRAKKLHR